MRSVLTESVNDLIDNLENEYNLPTTSEARKQAIICQGEDAIMMAILGMHVRGDSRDV